MKPKHDKRKVKSSRRCVHWDPALFKSEVGEKESRRKQARTKQKSDTYFTKIAKTVLRAPKRTPEEWQTYFDELGFGRVDMIRFYRLCGHHLVNRLLASRPGGFFRFVVNTIPESISKEILCRNRHYLLSEFIECQRIAVEWGHYSSDHRMKRIGILKLLVNMNQDVVFRYVARHWHDDFVSEGFQSEFLEAIEGLDMADAFEIPEPPAVAMPGV